MKTSKTYNGWKNYATWNVALWLGSDEGLYRACVVDAEDYKRMGTYYNGAHAAELVTNILPEGTPDMGATDPEWKTIHWPSIARMIRELA